MIDNEADISQEEIEEILKDLVDKGYVSTSEKEGKLHYTITVLGEASLLHAGSDPKTRN